MSKSKNGDFEVLGRRVVQNSEGIRVDQWDYLKKLKPVPVAKARKQRADASLTPGERTQFLSLTAQLAWPARTTIPALAYLASDLQRRVADAKVSDLVRANWVLKKAQELGRAGDCLWFRRNPLENQIMVLGVHDASFARQPQGGSQQGFLVMITSEEVLKTPKPVRTFLVDWASNKIHRVVRSTLAAEAASNSHAHARATLVRVLLAEILTGQDPEI